MDVCSSHFRADYPRNLAKMLHFCTFAPEFKVKEYKMSEFMTPPKHVNFRAKELFGAVGNIVDGAVAYIDLNGGGPTELHTHEHNHLFIVTEGEAKILLGDEEVIIHKDEAFLVEGRIPHSCWNNIEGVTKMIGITVI